MQVITAGYDDFVRNESDVCVTAYVVQVIPIVDVVTGCAD